MSREDDLLEQATRALRDEPPPTKEELADGRAVLMWAQRSAQRSKRQRGRTLRWVLPLAAVLTAGSALAATGQIERMAEAVTAFFAPERAAEKAKRARSPKRPSTAPMKSAAPRADSADAASAPAREPEPPAAPTPQVAPQVAPEVPVSPGPKSAKAPSRPRPSAAAEPTEGAPEKTAEPLPPPAVEPAPALKPSPDLAAYRTAHGLHFRHRDFGAALAAWDAYLEAFPRGTFAIEAIYNRAICLLRLGRKEEARRALLPFARGAMQNGYRRAEAQELLEALE